MFLLKNQSFFLFVKSSNAERPPNGISQVIKIYKNGQEKFHPFFSLYSTLSKLISSNIRLNVVLGVKITLTWLIMRVLNSSLFSTPSLSRFYPSTGIQAFHPAGF